MLPPLNPGISMSACVCASGAEVRERLRPCSVNVSGRHLLARTLAPFERRELRFECRSGLMPDASPRDISLAAVAASPAIVKSGKGRTDISGARRALLASTSGGDLYVKAVPHDYYQLSSRSGTIASNFVRPRLSLWTRAQLGHLNVWSRRCKQNQIRSSPFPIK